jgi:hypothetical protein
MLEPSYQTAIDSEGQPFLDAERDLVAQGPSAVAFLQEKQKSATNFTKLITQALLERAAGNPAFEAALTYFKEVEQRAAETPLGVPPPEAVAEYLFRHFGDAASLLLGVYLAKLGNTWPDWTKLGVIVYLGKLPSRVASEPLLQFITSTFDDHARNIAVQSLVGVGGVDALAKLEGIAQHTDVDVARAALQKAAEQIRAKLPR